MAELVDVHCPRCGNALQLQSGQSEEINCYTCGYHRSIVMEDIPKITELEGSGGYQVKLRGIAGIEMGSFAEPAAEQEFLDLCDQRAHEIEFARYTLWDGQTLTSVDVITQRD